MPVSLVSTGVTFPDNTTQTTAASAVTAGNGISVSSGTVAVACPSFNSVGSYCWGSITSGSNGTVYEGGSNYSAGSGTNQVRSGAFYNTNAGCCSYNTAPVFQNNLSGTWKYMGANNTVNNGDRGTTLFCRVS
jgi:hypothetical protein